MYQTKREFFDALYSKLESKVTADRERHMLQQSYGAFLAVDNREDARFAEMMDGDIVTNSESDNPDACLSIL